MHNILMFLSIQPSADQAFFSGFWSLNFLENIIFEFLNDRISILISNIPKTLIF